MMAKLSKKGATSHDIILSCMRSLLIYIYIYDDEDYWEI